MGDIKALCSICGQKWANVVCNNCLAYVCDNCFNKKKDVCLLCAQGLQFKKK